MSAARPQPGPDFLAHPKRVLTEAQFLKDVARHTLNILHDDGIYRHLRFQKPNDSDMYFDIVTYPGTLCYSGDMGSFVFARVNDMLTFFRGHHTQGELQVNPHYWAQKVEAVDRHSDITEYSPAKVRAAIDALLDSVEASPELRERVADEVLPHADDEFGMMSAIRDFDDEDQLFSDFYEGGGHTEYTGRFLWCCYALVWGIRRYDEARLAIIDNV